MSEEALMQEVALRDMTIEFLEEENMKLNLELNTKEAEIERLRAVINEQSDAHVAHVKGLQEKREAERKILVGEVATLRAALKGVTSELDQFVQIFKGYQGMTMNSAQSALRAAAAALKEMGDE